MILSATALTVQIRMSTATQQVYTVISCNNLEENINNIFVSITYHVKLITKQPMMALWMRWKMMSKETPRTTKNIMMCSLSSAASVVTTMENANPNLWSLSKMYAVAAGKSQLISPIHATTNPAPQLIKYRYLVSNTVLQGNEHSTHGRSSRWGKRHFRLSRHTALIPSASITQKRKGYKPEKKTSRELGFRQWRAHKKNDQKKIIVLSGRHTALYRFELILIS